MIDVTQQIKKLRQRLDALKIFPNNKEVKILRDRIKRQLSRLEKKQKIKKLNKQEKNQQANQSRSGKLRRYHNYIRQIRNNFPNLDYNTIRAELTTRRQGKPSKIPDAIWQNPSP